MSDDQLWPGQFVNARLLLRTEPNALTVPSVAVQHGPAGLYVYVVQPNATVKRQDVQVERDDGKLAVIAQGLQDGQTVVTNGYSRLQDGATRHHQQPDRRTRRCRSHVGRLSLRAGTRRMSISTPFIRRPVATSLVMAALVLIGIAAYPFLPVAPLPRVDFPTINVNAKFPGASPETMASTVAQPLERQFAAISGIAQMTSVSVQGQAVDHPAVRPGPRHRRRGRRRAARDQRAPAASCRRPCRRRRPTGR